MTPTPTSSPAPAAVSRRGSAGSRGAAGDGDGNRDYDRVDLRSRLLWRAYKRFREHRAAQAGGLLIIALILVGIFAPHIAPYSPSVIDLGNRLATPTWEHWLGTDHLGRDILSRVLHGARISVLIGVISVGIALLGGLPLGAIAGYVGGGVDRVLAAIVDFLLAFPPLLLAILIIAIFGLGLRNAMIAIGISLVPIFARLIRAETMRVREEVYVESVRALGAGHLRIVMSHIFPNALPPIIVQVTLSMATAMLSASYLGFLGLGAQPPSPEWGRC